MFIRMKFKEIIEKAQPAKVLAVSKLQAAAKVRTLHAEGQRLFGENYVQEALKKQSELQDLTDIQWHFIGHLQKNKAKMVAGSFSLIHSVDSLELAQTLSRQCEQKNVEQNILIQVNLSGEASKEGFDRQSLAQDWARLTQLPHLHILGLMTMPPLTETGSEVRPYFEELRLLRDHLRSQTDLTTHPMNELSMGTSHDFEVAVEEGATIVRLGTILFGERPAKG